MKMKIKNLFIVDEKVIITTVLVLFIGYCFGKRAAKIKSKAEGDKEE